MASVVPVTISNSDCKTVCMFMSLSTTEIMFIMADIGTSGFSLSSFSSMPLIHYHVLMKIEIYTK